jgi:hypothetical protein
LMRDILTLRQHSRIIRLSCIAHAENLNTKNWRCQELKAHCTF